MLEENTAFVQGFLSKLRDDALLDDADKTKGLVHDCVYLLSRLGYSPNTVNVKNKQFLKDAMHELGLNSEIGEENSDVADADGLVQGPVEEEAGKSSKNLESFMEAVKSIKNPQNKNPTSLVRPVLHRDWLMQSKVSFNDSDNESANDTGKTELLIDEDSFRDSQLNFVRNINGKLVKLSRLAMADRQFQENVQSVEDSLIKDIQSFCNFVRSLEKTVETNSRIPASSADSMPHSEEESADDSEDDKPLISGSFVKITKSHTEQFTPYKSMFS